MQKVDPVTAARRAFGDLKQLQSNLESYIHQGMYSYFKLPASTAVDDTAFQVCAEHVRQLGGGSPLPNLVEVKG